MLAVNLIFAGLLVLAAAAVFWWWHRSRMAAMRRQLREAQDSQLEFAEAAATLHRRLAEADQALVESETLLDAAERRAALERALAAAAPAPAHWQDTLPQTLPTFAATEPVKLEEALR